MLINEKRLPPGLRCRPTYSSLSVTVPVSKPADDGVHGLYAGSIRSSVAMRSPPGLTLASGAPVAGETRGTLVQIQQHPGVAQCVRLDVFEPEELGHAGVIGTAQLVVGVVVDRGAVDLDEPGAAEELDVEGQR